jgi:hypothetical protein
MSSDALPQPPGYRLHLWVAVLAAAALTVESWALGPLSWMYGYGGGLETIPTYLALSFDHRNFSLWSPFVGGGLPRLAFWGNADPLSPELLLFSLLPTWLAYGLHRYVQYLIAVFFASRVAEEQLALPPSWAALAGLLQGCFAYLTTGTLLTIASVPLLVWLLARLSDPRRGLLAAVLGGLAFSLLTTFTFSVPYLLVFAAGWLLAVRSAFSWHAVRQFLVFSCTLMVAECPQLLAVMASAPLSHRAGWPGEPLSFTIDGLFYRRLQFDLFSKDRYLEAVTMGVPGLAFFLGFVLFAAARRFRPDLRPVCGLGPRVFLLFALASQKWLWLLLQAGVSKVFPWAMGVYMGRFFEVPAAFLIACVLAIDCYLVWNLLPRLLPVRAAMVGLAAGFLAFMTVWPKIDLCYPLGVDDWGEKHFQVAAVEAIKRRETEPFRVVSVLPLQPAYAYAQGLECADGWANIFPAVYRDLWLRTMTPLFGKLPVVKDVFDPVGRKPQDNYIFLGADLVRPDVGLLPGECLGRCVQEGFDLDARFNLDLLRALNVKYLLSEYPLRGPGVQLVHAPDDPPVAAQPRDYATGLLVQRLTTPQERAVLGHPRRALADLAAAAKRKRRGKDVFVYELLGALPRFRFVREAVVEPTGKAVLDRVASFDAARHARCVVLEAADATPLGNRTQFSAGAVQVVRYTADEIELRLANPGDGLLVIANTYDPHWRAEVDGRPRPLLRVNHAQYGIVTVPTDSRVRLFYAPPYSILRLISRLGLTGN